MISAFFSTPTFSIARRVFRSRPCRCSAVMADHLQPICSEPSFKTSCARHARSAMLRSVPSPVFAADTISFVSYLCHTECVCCRNLDTHLIPARCGHARSGSTYCSSCRRSNSGQFIPSISRCSCDTQPGHRGRSVRVLGEVDKLPRLVLSRFHLREVFIISFGIQGS